MHWKVEKLQTFYFLRSFCMTFDFAWHYAWHMDDRCMTCVSQMRDRRTTQLIMHCCEHFYYGIFFAWHYAWHYIQCRCTCHLCVTCHAVCVWYFCMTDTWHSIFMFSNKNDRRITTLFIRNWESISFLWSFAWHYHTWHAWHSFAMHDTSSFV